MPNLTLADIQADLDAIHKEAGDPEAQHGIEDWLHTRTLAAIAEGNHRLGDSAALAKLAMTSCEIKFPRWTA